MKVEAERYKQRLETCKRCESFNKTFSRCKKCGCLMKIKAWITKSKCPLNKWKWQHIEN